MYFNCRQEKSSVKEICNYTRNNLYEVVYNKLKAKSETDTHAVTNKASTLEWFDNINKQIEYNNKYHIGEYFYQKWTYNEWNFYFVLEKLDNDWRLSEAKTQLGRCLNKISYWKRYFISVDILCLCTMRRKNKTITFIQ